jgi:uncharacterized protein (TIGR02145 family)
MKSNLNAKLLLLAFLFISNYLAVAQIEKDTEGNDFKTIKYGRQEWSVNNLNLSHFSNGDTIPEARTNEEWIKAGAEGKPAWCYFNNDPENGKIYGKLYNWYAINDPRGLAPQDWNIPISADWITLVANLLGVDVAGLKLKSKTGWKSTNGSDNIGFSALPGGYRDENGAFKELGTKAQWWANSEPFEPTKSNQIYSFSLNDFTVEASYVKMNKASGLSVRCVKKIK